MGGSRKNLGACNGMAIVGIKTCSVRTCIHLNYKAKNFTYSFHIQLTSGGVKVTLEGTVPPQLCYARHH